MFPRWGTLFTYGKALVIRIFFSPSKGRLCSKEKIMFSIRSRNNNETTSPSQNTYDNKIFSILSRGRAWTRLILAGKRDTCRHSTIRVLERKKERAWRKWQKCHLRYKVHSRSFTCTLYLDYYNLFSLSTVGEFCWSIILTCNVHKNLQKESKHSSSRVYVHLTKTSHYKVSMVEVQ